DYGRGTSRGRAEVSVVAGAAITALVVGWWAAPLAVAVLVAVLTTGTLAKRKIDGISGDVLGACEQVAECLGLVALTGLASHHPLWWT
ncbi:MAG: adenosylcobinamide-GDP ribazoletransferase, partial [Actinomycetota bacterium]|nr:adenosylcobinamide-GDP ribazoletransferase [Actinomycetota bacterium]